MSFHTNNSQQYSLTGLEHYYDQNDYNKTFYYKDSTGTEDQLLLRCLSEQTVIENDYVDFVIKRMEVFLRPCFKVQQIRMQHSGKKQENNIVVMWQI